MLYQKCYRIALLYVSVLGVYCSRLMPSNLPSIGPSRTAGKFGVSQSSNEVTVTFFRDTWRGPGINALRFDGGMSFRTANSDDELLIYDQKTGFHFYLLVRIGLQIRCPRTLQGKVALISVQDNKMSLQEIHGDCQMIRG